MDNPTISRRELIRRGGALGTALALPVAARAEAQSTAASATGGATGTVLRTDRDVYKSIGVRPLINGRGTFTIIS